MGCLSCAGFVKGTGGATPLALKGRLPATVKVGGLTQESLAGRSIHEIAVLPVVIGPDKAALEDVFYIDPGQAEGVIHKGDLAILNGLGKGMGHGRLTVLGNAGAHLGANMRGGEILVQDNAGEYAGAILFSGGRENRSPPETCATPSWSGRLCRAIDL